MDWKLGGLIAAALAWPPMTQANEQTDRLVATYATCAAMYRVFSEVALASERPASSEHMLGLANGAEFTAAFLLAMDRKSSGAASAATYGDWIDKAVRPEVDGEMMRIRAILEDGEAGALDQQTSVCIEAGKATESILDAQRKQRAGG